MKWLLDTCVISELVSKHPNRAVIDWIDSVEPESLYLSVITIGEIAKGIQKLPPSKRKRELHRWLTEDLLLRFDGRILVLDVDVLLAWGQLTGKLESKGRRMSAIDSLVAAIALHGDLTVVTRSVSDYRHSGVLIFNPWGTEAQPRLVK
jgi:predicted nucleic acid-binding protein